MIITYQGDSYVKLQAGDTVILIDPTNYRSFKGALLALHTSLPTDLSKEETDTFWIDHQGEYEVQEIRIQGTSAGFYDKKEHTVYKLTLDDISVGIIGGVSKAPTPEMLEYIQGVDVLILPAGGKPYISAQESAQLVRQIEPGFVIPTLFGKHPDQFLKELDQEKASTEEKLTIKKKDVTEGAGKVVVLKA
jgi:L-ascorbate metabolism protein UlaG (beta-lactamase superfamily)